MEYLGVLRRFLSPLGALTMLLSCWLPWADVSCQTVHTTPTYWQLADYDHRLYALVALSGLVLVLGTLIWIRPNPGKIAAHLLAAIACVAGWFFLWLKREDVLTYQAQAQGMGGDAARLMNDIVLAPGSGFMLYLAGAMLALLAGILHLVKARSPG
jgi:hypothetical protein